MTVCFLKQLMRPVLLLTFCSMHLLATDVACQQTLIKPKVQHLIKTPLFGLVNPFYPEFQLGYGFQTADKWAIHITAGILYDLGTFEAEDEIYTKYGGRASISFRWILTDAETATTDWFIGLRAMGSQLTRKKQGYFWDDDFNFEQWQKLKGVTDSFSFIFDAGFVSNNYRRTALELFIGLGSKTYRRLHPELPAHISPNELYNFFERGHLLPHWKTVPAMSFNLNFIYRIGVGKSD